jgi:hypothetical protein
MNAVRVHRKTRAGLTSLRAAQSQFYEALLGAKPGTPLSINLDAVRLQLGVLVRLVEGKTLPLAREARTEKEAAHAS